MTNIPKHVTRLYLDTNIFIYLLEGSMEFADPVGEIITEAGRRGITLVTSEFAICECLVGAHRRNDPELIAQYEAFFNDARQSIEILAAQSEVLNRAPQISGALRLKLIDSLHVSSALLAGCNGFCTNDAGIPSIEGELDIIRLT